MTVNRPCRTPFSILNQPVVLYKILTVASWPAYRFLRRPVRWSGIPVSLSFPQFVIIRTVEGFSVVNETEVDVFLEFPCFLCDPANVGNLVSGSSAFSKPSLNIWKFSVHIMLKPSMQDFKHNLTSMGDECNCLLVWTFFSTALLGNWDKDWPFHSCGYLTPSLPLNFEQMSEMYFSLNWYHPQFQMNCFSTSWYHYVAFEEGLKK